MLPRLFFPLLLAAVVCTAAAQPRPDQPRSDQGERLVDLRGQWLFRLGDDLAWAAPDFFDKDWETLFVPAKWEDEGFWGYDGYAWYRKHFQLSEAPKDHPLYVDLGRIDDVAAIYVNGHFVGASGRFPPAYQTGYHQHRSYRIPPAFLRPGGRNVIAVRVFDAGMGGGLVEGRPGLYVAPNEPVPLVDLAGTWAFRTGDHAAWRDAAFDDAGWGALTAPGRWEPQGHGEYDGYAWYRRRFVAPRDLNRDDLVLVLGRIDDLDEVFLNGRRIGGTGRIDERRIGGDEWQVVRVYEVPADGLRYGAENVLAVRVYDGLYDGGIFEGPLGLVRRQDVDRLVQPAAPKKEGFWDVIWKTFFNEMR